MDILHILKTFVHVFLPQALPIKNLNFTATFLAHEGRGGWGQGEFYRHCIGKTLHIHILTGRIIGPRKSPCDRFPISQPLNREFGNGGLF